MDVRGRVALAPPGKDTSAGLFGLEAWRKAHSRRREKHRSRLPRVVWLASPRMTRAGPFPPYVHLDLCGQTGGRKLSSSPRPAPLGSMRTERQTPP